MELLQINPQWRMCQVSDGQRRRVQIMLNLLQYLTKECTTRGVTIVYATHIFDAMDGWPTHVAYLTAGRLTFFGTTAEFHRHMPAASRTPVFASKLMTILAQWIRRDRKENLKKEREHDKLKNTFKAPDGSAGGFAPGRSALMSAAISIVKAKK